MPFDMSAGVTKDTLKEFKLREMNRILDAPVIRPLSPTMNDKFSKATLLPSAEIPSLLDVQSDAIVAYLRNGGLWGYIGVGRGKALISVACACAAYRKGLRKIILMIPPKLTLQTVEKVIPWLRRQMPVNLPVHVISGKTKANRLKASKEKSGLFIMAWSQLSIVDTDELINNIAPQLIIADEAHNLSNKTSSRYKRVNRWMIEHPETEFIALSGTMAKKGIKDYAHLLRWCLKDKAPIPDTDSELVNWQGVIDTTFSEYTSSTVLHPMLLWANRNGNNFERDIAGYRKAYNYRLGTTSGVVFAVGDGDLGTSITFCNKPVEVPDDYPGMPKLQELISQLHDMDMSPDGDILDFAIHKFRIDFELTCGFYNSLLWPEVEVISKRKKITMDQAEDLLHRSKEYHRAAQDYHRQVRLWLRDFACEKLDTPFLLGTSMGTYKRHMEKYRANLLLPVDEREDLEEPMCEVGEELYDSWITMKSFDFDDRISRDSKAVRVCDYKVKAAVDWVKSLPKKRGGVIIWYKRQEIGKWCYELLKEAGLDAVLCDSGKQGYENMNNSEYHKSKIMVASVDAYNAGINAQPVEHVYFLQFPREADRAEQCIGRNHRTGSPYDELTYTTNFSNKWDHTMYSSVLADSLFQHQAGAPHKLIYGNYEEPPQIASSASMKAMGLITKDIDQRVINDLKAVFE